MKWTTAMDLVNDINATRERLESGKDSIEKARVLSKIYGTATKGLALMLDHAKVTGRLRKGVRSLPDFEMPKTRKRSP